MHTQTAAPADQRYPSLTTMWQGNRHSVMLFAELQATRHLLVDSLALAPDDVDGREELWIRLYELLREAENVRATTRHVLALIDESDATCPGLAIRASSAISHIELGWCPGDPAVPGVDMPADERERLAALYTDTIL